MMLECEEKVARCTVVVTNLGYDVYARIRGPLEGLGCSIASETFHEGVDIKLLLEEEKLEQVAP